MELASGITQEDLKLFLQEADEQIQLLDEDIVRLEKESTNPDLLQEIFRAAHTLKGSSAMVGHQRLSDLAHAMENVLDNLRKETLAISPPVVDAMLHGLDVMRILRREFVMPDAPATDITEATKELAAVMKTEGHSVKKHVTKVNTLSLDSDAKEKLAQARKEGKKAFQIKVVLDKKSVWTSVPEGDPGRESRF
jgi:two-component system chemotaxis sensor kinase CheA